MPFLLGLIALFTSRGGRALLLFILVCGPLSCSGSSRSSPTSAQRPDVYFTAIDFRDWTVELQSPDARDSISIEVAYHAALRSDEPPSRIEALERAISFKSPEGSWLLLYLQDAAIKFANGQALPPGVECKILRGERSVHQGEWFPSYLVDSEFGVDTLAIRDAGQAASLELLPGTGTETRWIAFTPQSYPVWWTQLERRLRLEQIFSAIPEQPVTTQSNWEAEVNSGRARSQTR